MPTIDRQDSVLNILRNLRDLDGLKRLFWEELNYERENRPLSHRQWPESARQPLAEDPILFASGGEDNAFHVVYCRLESDALLRGHERPIVNRLTREHPYALFVFSNKGRTDWHFLNVKYDEEADKRRLLRRITVRPGEGLRTAAERMQMLDLETISPDLFALSPLTIQQRHDDAFDVEKVSKDFYREIANWYFWALKHATFPKDAPKEEDGRDHISVIRLITRLIFCWFIREKGLIPDVLFDESKLAEMLDGFAPGKTRNKDSVFYRAILQNLFFATLNTEMDQRGWRRPGQNLMAHILYRHKECFRDPKAGLEWFKDIPFLNGGLFECLDRDKGEGVKDRYVRVDGFSDRDDSRPTVPDFLFFGSEQDVDLSEDYGDKKFRSVRVRGLIDTLNRYKFTIEENTPFDQEVALDPELCGKVFENLLAAYNPETGTTARKATGSFYTPREIVDYMVDESLVAYLKGNLTGKTAKDSDKALRALLAYDGEPHGFDEKATGELIDAIDGLKALDPAVGSGAFPMGILHKLVLVLGKLDPDNERWKAKQIAKLDDATMREDAERLFRENYDDYGRKLYLIENCIYGVDIQPIAVQIAKMRFFISLIVDQKVNPKADNLGVRALPNLETKFVAANTLIGIDRPAQMMLRNPDIDKKEAELRKVREKHFTARTLKSKAKCREDDKRLRAEIADLLRTDGWDDTTAKQLAAWDPYDQNASAPFFDSEWMFGLTDGFDIVIGNPPWGIPFTPAEKKDLKANYVVARGIIDSFALFIERGDKLLTARGILAMILPDIVLLKAYPAVRKYILERHVIRSAVFWGEAFDAVNLDTCTLICAKEADHTARSTHSVQAITSVTTSDIREGAKRIPQSVFDTAPDYKINLFWSEESAELKKRIEKGSVPFSDLFHSHEGIHSGNIRAKLFLTQKRGRNCRPLIFGRDEIRPFGITWAGKYVDYSEDVIDKANGEYANLAHEEYFTGPKLFVRRTGDFVMAAVDRDGFFASNNLFVCVPVRGLDLDCISAILNSRLMTWFFRCIQPRVGRLFAELKIVHLNTFPIRMGNGKDMSQLATLAKKIKARTEADRNADISRDLEDVNRLVYQVYGMSQSDIAVIEGEGR